MRSNGQPASHPGQGAVSASAAPASACTSGILVGVRGFEPPAPASRTQCSTRLSYTPAKAAHIALGTIGGKARLQPLGLGAGTGTQLRQPPQNSLGAVEHLVQLAHLG